MTKRDASIIIQPSTARDGIARRAALSEPRAEMRPFASMWHGIPLADEFAWLKAANWQEVMRNPAALDPAIRAYLEAENAYADTAMADTSDLQAALYDEMLGRIEQDESTVPSLDGPYAYYVSYREGGQHPIHRRQACASCSTATRWPRASLISSSVRPGTRPIIATLPGPSMRPGQSFSRFTFG